MVIISPEQIKQEIYNKFSPVFQHDCHEFFTYIMSNLQDEETPVYTNNKVSPRIVGGGQVAKIIDQGQDVDSAEESWAKFESTHPSIIDTLFSGNVNKNHRGHQVLIFNALYRVAYYLPVGMQKTVVTCGKCFGKSITYNPFMTLSLAFESTLDKCIGNFLKEDSLECSSKDGGDMYKCDKCKKSSQAKIKTELSKLPNIIVFHLKRFQFPSMKKITSKVKYTSYINMDK
jgi:ubiquitin C-terminal hydrolase